ncbi:MutL C-terminal dimerization domain-containing protein [[Candida] zeylanoides]
MSIIRLDEHTRSQLDSLAHVSSLGDVLDALLSNCADAGATEVAVVVDAATHSIQVSDNGEGIVDMAHVGLCGYSSRAHRSGRALHSVAQVGVLTVISQRGGGPPARLRAFQGQRQLSSGCDFVHPGFRYRGGTSVAVSSVFAAVPVRRASMAAHTTWRQVRRAALKFAVMHPIALAVCAADRRQFAVPRSAAPGHAYNLVYGTNLAFDCVGGVWVSQAVRRGERHLYGPGTCRRVETRGRVVVAWLPPGDATSAVTRAIARAAAPASPRDCSGGGRAGAAPPQSPSLAPPPPPRAPLSLTLRRCSLAEGNFRVVGQLDRKFILLTSTTPPSLLAIDQHACDERIRVEALLRHVVAEILDPAVDMAVPLASPCATALTTEEAQLLAAHADAFSAWGVRFSHSAVTHAPKLLATADVQWSEAVSTYLHQIARGEKLRFSRHLDWFENARHLPQVLLDAINRRACRASIMFGTPLTKPEMDYLVAHMGQCRMPFECAHGRPSVTVVADLADGCK